MYSDPQNPFAAAGQPASNGAPAPNPFQAAAPQAPAEAAAPAANPFQAAAPASAPEASSPFAGVGSDSPFGLVDSNAGRPAKLPERRFPETAASGANGSLVSNGQSPFERAVSSVASPSPFEAVVGGPTEGFLAERPPVQAPPPVQYEPAPVAAPAPAAFEAPIAHSVTMPNGNPNGAAFVEVPKLDVPNVAEVAFTPVSPPPAQKNGSNGGLQSAYQNEFVVPPVATAPAPVAAPQQAETPPAQNSVAHGGTPQLVLRAIFGVNHELNADEMLQRARTLPGVRNLQVVGAEEAQAMRVLRSSVSRMGFGDHHSLALSSADGAVDIIEEEGTTLAVLHEEGGYAAGVRETLIIVTRELARLTS